LQEKLNESALKYFYDDARITTYSITKGESCHIIDSLATGVIPSEIFVAVVESNRHFGNFKTNCMRFPLILRDEKGQGTGTSVTSCKLFCGGTEVDGLSEEPSDGEYSMDFYKFYILQRMLTGQDHLSADIDPQRYKTDTKFHYWNLKCGLAESPQWLSSPVKSGFLRLVLRFSANTVAPMTVYVLTLSQAAIVMRKGGAIRKETT